MNSTNGSSTTTGNVLTATSTTLTATPINAATLAQAGQLQNVTDLNQIIAAGGQVIPAGKKLFFFQIKMRPFKRFYGKFWIVAERKKNLKRSLVNL